MTASEFAEAVSRALERASVREIADGLGISHSTVNRWAAGRSSPHPAMRGPVLKWFRGMGLL